MIHYGLMTFKRIYTFKLLLIYILDFLGLDQGHTLLFSCAEPITIEFVTAATVERCQVRRRT